MIRSPNVSKTILYFADGALCNLAHLKRNALISFNLLKIGGIPSGPSVLDTSLNVNCSKTVHVVHIKSYFNTQETAYILR